MNHNQTTHMLQTNQINEMQRMYASLLKKEYKEILGLHMTELMVLNYAHHVRNNDTFILRRDSQNLHVNGQIKSVSIFYISKTNLYSRPMITQTFQPGLSRTTPTAFACCMITTQFACDPNNVGLVVSSKCAQKIKCGLHVYI